jgi:hypothetical protein
LKQSCRRNSIQEGLYSTQNIPEMTGKLGKKYWGATNIDGYMSNSEVKNKLKFVSSEM